MSQKDLQFIERALAHPWMFWVYCWKWPRIVRQACAEYDLLAKERDAAKAAHERSERANRIVRDWIHVTHRLSTTPEAIRAIFAAGKRLSILLVFFVVTNTYGQAPPYLRNQWTTNANPLALKVISTNGVHAATNVWELDFTNTATVTVSAVSNANKVMVSFTGSASSGSSSLTNALLHAGPTNGSVDALILTAGNGVTLTTSGTNRIAAIDTNVVAEVSDLLWTNNGTYTHLILSTNIVQFYPLRTVFGFPDDGDEENFNTVTITNGGIGALDHAFETDPADNPGSIALARNGGVAAASYFLSTNCTIRGSEGGVGGGYMDSSVACRSEGSDGSWGGISATLSTNVSVKGSSGSFAGGYSREGTNITVLGLNASAAFGYHDRSSEAKTTVFKSGMAVSYMEQAHYNTNTADRSIQIASFVGARTNTLSSIRTISAISFFGTNGQAAGVDSLVVGLVGSNERMYAGDASGVGAVASSAIGRDLAGTNNWTFGLHGTNSIPFSLALVNNGTQFQVTSNGNPSIIRGVSGYSWPTAHAAGALTNDGTGGMGWKPLSDFVSGLPATNPEQFVTNGTTLIIKPEAKLTNMNSVGTIWSVGNTTTNDAQFGTFGIQSFAVNNGWLSDNAYYNGGFIRRAAGAVEMLYFFNEQIRFRHAVSGAAGSSFTPTDMMALDMSGGAAILSLKHGGGIGFASTPGAVGNDAGLTRTAAAILRVTDGSLVGSGNTGSLTVSNLTAEGVASISKALKVGIANQASITNILAASATLDFPSTSSGAVADLAITVTGAASGDVVDVGVPQGSATGIIGSYSGFASNNTVFVRFTPTAATQDPASGTFRALVTKF